MSRPRVRTGSSPPLRLPEPWRGPRGRQEVYAGSEAGVSSPPDSAAIPESTGTRGANPFTVRGKRTSTTDEQSWYELTDAFAGGRFVVWQTAEGHRGS